MEAAKDIAIDHRSQMDDAYGYPVLRFKNANVCRLNSLTFS